MGPVIGALGWLGAPALAAPGDDVTRLRAEHAALLELAQAEVVDERAARAVLADHVTERVREMALAAGIPKGWLDRPDLAKAADRSVAGAVLAVASAAPADRPAAVSATLRQVYSARFAHDVMAEWLDLPPLATGELPAALVGGAREQHPDAAPRFVADGVRVLHDSGGAGSGNGSVDAGDWVQLEIPVVNPSALPWVSASGTWATPSPCVYLPTPRAGELPELPPDGVGAVTVDLYVDAECAQDVLPLSLAVLDTHRAPQAPVTLTLFVPVHRVASTTSAAVRFDRDDLGWSDGRGLDTLDPNGRLELSSGVEVTPLNWDGTGPWAAVQTWAHARYAGPALSAFRDPAPAPMPVVSAGGRGIPYRFAMADDLDVGAPAEDVFDSAVQAMARARGWRDPQEAGFVLRLDTTVRAPLAAPPPAAKPPRLPAAAEVEQFLLGQVRIDIDHAPPEAGEVDRVEAITARLDDGFAAAWDRFATGAAPAAAPPAVLFHLTHYVWVPLQWTPEPARPEPPKVAEAPQEPNVLHAGFGVGFATVTRRADDLAAGDTEPSLGLLVGVGARGRVLASYEYRPSSRVTLDEEREYQAMQFGAGAGYAERLGDDLEIEVAALAQLYMSAIWGDGEFTGLPDVRQFSLVLVPRLTVSGYLTRQVSLDGRAFATAPLAVLTVIGPNEGPAPVNPGGFGLSAGLSLHW